MQANVSKGQLVQNTLAEVAFVKSYALGKVELFTYDNLSRVLPESGLLRYINANDFADITYNSRLRAADTVSSTLSTASIS